MKITEFRKLIREEVRKVINEAVTKPIKPGTKGTDINDYPLEVVAGPFDSVAAVKAIIKTKYTQANDIFTDKDIVWGLKHDEPGIAGLGGFYLCKGRAYKGSGYNIVNGVDIFPGAKSSV